jgi:F0F1-type ATP synthase assembly protein I
VRRDGASGPSGATGPSWVNLLGIGSASALILAAGFGLGWWLDSLLHTSPALTLAGILVGLVGAGSYTVIQIRKFLRT